MFKDRKGDFGVLSVEVTMEAVELEKTSKGKSTWAAENNENDMLWERQMHLGDKNK